MYHRSIIFARWDTTPYITFFEVNICSSILRNGNTNLGNLTISVEEDHSIQLTIIRIIEYLDSADLMTSKFNHFSSHAFLRKQFLTICSNHLPQAFIILYGDYSHLFIDLVVWHDLNNKLSWMLKHHLWL